MKKILIIEDEKMFQEAIQLALEEEEYHLTFCDDGILGLETAKEINPDMILLDVMLPGKNGIEILKELRTKSHYPLILMLTSKSDETDKIIGFEFGADDYLTKPFSLVELKLRIKALFRRNGKTLNNQVSSDNVSIKIGDVKINLEAQEIISENIKYNISGKEFQILKFFIENPNKVITRDILLDKIWGYDNFPSTRTVDNFILSLRKKIEINPSDPKYIITVPTLGYKFIPDGNN